MKIKEKQLLIKFLEDHVERLGNDGCNDFDFPKDWSMQEQLEFSHKIAPEYYAEMNGIGVNGIGVFEDNIPIEINTIVLEGLIKLLKTELNLDTPPD